ncbi:lipoprotein 17-related variable surface protein [Mycoplasmopsis columbinasalis]|uniref:Lipoprotein associated domain n=1 Tax=Mycoplasmopsis columbinasalis TaxID=114880 RepID=A0A449BB57_9BACT|nr:lipoprotein 17-related variable surface protein [Mycoplasmopsis columbinasalis]VEU78421.1 Lipoprotein associated domain [Mycoplasmopsis columbinasalis]
MGRKRIITLGVIGGILALSGGISAGTYKLVQNRTQLAQQHNVEQQLQNELQTNTQMDVLNVIYTPTNSTQKLADISLAEADLNNFQLLITNDRGVATVFTQVYPDYDVTFAFKESEFYVALGKAKLIITITNKLNHNVSKTFEWPELFSGFKVEQTSSTDLPTFADNLLTNPAATVVYDGDVAKILPSQASATKLVFGFTTATNTFEDFRTTYGDQTGGIIPVLGIDQAKSNDRTGELAVTLQLKIPATGYETKVKWIKLSGFQTQTDADGAQLEQLLTTIQTLDYISETKNQVLVAQAQTELDNFGLYDSQNQPVVLPADVLATKEVLETSATAGSIKINLTLSKNNVTRTKTYLVEGFKTVRNVQEESLAAELDKFTRVRVSADLQTQFAQKLPSQFDLDLILGDLIFSVDESEKTILQYNNNNDFKLNVEKTAMRPVDQNGQLLVDFYLTNTNFDNGQLKSEVKTFTLSGFKTANKLEKEQAITTWVHALDHIEFPLSKDYQHFLALDQATLTTLILNNLKAFDSNNQLLSYDSALNYEVVAFNPSPFHESVTFKLRVSYDDFALETKELTINNLETRQDYVLTQAANSLGYYQWNTPDQSPASAHLPSEVVSDFELRKGFVAYQPNGQVFENQNQHLTITTINFLFDDKKGAVTFETRFNYREGDSVAKSITKNFEVYGFATSNSFYTNFLQNELAQIKTVAFTNYAMLASQAAAIVADPTQARTVIKLYRDEQQTTTYQSPNDVTLSFSVRNFDETTGQLQIYVHATKNSFSAQKLFTLTGFTTFNQNLLNKLVAATTTESVAFSATIDKEVTSPLVLADTDLIFKDDIFTNILGEYKDDFDVSYTITQRDANAGAVVVTVSFWPINQPNLRQTKALTFTGFKTFAAFAHEVFDSITALKLSENRVPNEFTATQAAAHKSWFELWTNTNKYQASVLAAFGLVPTIETLEANEARNEVTATISVPLTYQGATPTGDNGNKLTKTLSLGGFYSAQKLELNQLLAQLNIDAANKSNTLLNPTMPFNKESWDRELNLAWTTNGQVLNLTSEANSLQVQATPTLDIENGILTLVVQLGRQNIWSDQRTFKIAGFARLADVIAREKANLRAHFSGTASDFLPSQAVRNQQNNTFTLLNGDTQYVPSAHFALAGPAELIPHDDTSSVTYKQNLVVVNTNINFTFTTQINGFKTQAQHRAETILTNLTATITHKQTLWPSTVEATLRENFFANELLTFVNQNNQPVDLKALAQDGFTVAYENLTSDNQTGTLFFAIAIRKDDFVRTKYFELTGFNAVNTSETNPQNQPDVPLTLLEFKRLELAANLNKIGRFATYKGTTPAQGLFNHQVDFFQDVQLFYQNNFDHYQLPQDLAIVLTNTTYDTANDKIIFTIKLVDTVYNLESETKDIYLDDIFGTDQSVFDYWLSLSYHAQLNTTSAPELNKQGTLASYTPRKFVRIFNEYANHAGYRSVDIIRLTTPTYNLAQLLGNQKLAEHGIHFTFRNWITPTSDADPVAQTQLTAVVVLRVGTYMRELNFTFDGFANAEQVRAEFEELQRLFNNRKVKFSWETAAELPLVKAAGGLKYFTPEKFLNLLHNNSADALYQIENFIYVQDANNNLIKLLNNDYFRQKGISIELNSLRTDPSLTRLEASFEIQAIEMTDTNEVQFELGEPRLALPSELTALWTEQIRKASLDTKALFQDQAHLDFYYFTPSEFIDLLNENSHNSSYQPENLFYFKNGQDQLIKLLNNNNIAQTGATITFDSWNRAESVEGKLVANINLTINNVTTKVVCELSGFKLNDQESMEKLELIDDLNYMGENQSQITIEESLAEQNRNNWVLTFRNPDQNNVNPWDAGYFIFAKNTSLYPEILLFASRADYEMALNGGLSYSPPYDRVKIFHFAFQFKTPGWLSVDSGVTIKNVYLANWSTALVGFHSDTNENNIFNTLTDTNTELPTKIIRTKDKNEPTELSPVEFIEKLRNQNLNEGRNENALYSLRIKFLPKNAAINDNDSYHWHLLPGVFDVTDWQGDSERVTLWGTGKYTNELDLETGQPASPVPFALNKFFGRDEYFGEGKYLSDPVSGEGINVDTAWIRFQKLVATHLTLPNGERKPILQIYYTATFLYNEIYHIGYFVAQDTLDWKDFSGPDVELQLSPDPSNFDSYEGKFGWRSYMSPVYAYRNVEFDTKIQKPNKD